MEKYLKEMVEKATENVNLYSNRPGLESSNQWYYWMGRRDAYQEILDSIREKATV